MNRIVLKSRVGSNGILQLALPVGPADADRGVQITVEPIGPPAVSPDTLSPDEWRQGILETAGKWQGKLERPNQMTLVTHNTTEFSRVPGLTLEDWQ